MMRSVFIIAAIILAACTVPPMEQKPETKAVPVSPTIEITAPRETEAPKVKEHKPKAIPAPSTHPCAGIETGDAKSDIKAKLECLEEHG
jgi:hypothetical protein